MKTWLSYCISWLVLCTLPFTAIAKEIAHPKVPADSECSECHGDQARIWENGKHGLMNVKCVVCHGAPDKNFAAKPGIYKCRGCHGEQVKDVERKLPPKVRDCFLCHEAHSVTGKFHTQGGK